MHTFAKLRNIVQSNKHKTFTFNAGENTKFSREFKCFFSVLEKKNRDLIISQIKPKAVTKLQEILI